MGTIELWKGVINPEMGCNLYGEVLGEQGRPCCTGGGLYTMNRVVGDKTPLGSASSSTFCKAHYSLEICINTYHGSCVYYVDDRVILGHLDENAFSNFQVHDGLQ